ncbi:MAG: histidine phosphatase family protein [archaeon]|nr:histidine phosphatase family protein [archaeon]
MVKTKIFLIRHGKSKGNIEMRFQGWNDTPLSELGVKQAILLRNYFANKKIDLVFHSPLKRAYQTALIAFKGKEIPFIKEKGLIERNFGKLDGMSLEELKKEHPEAESFYYGEINEINGFGVESVVELQERSFETLKTIAEKNEGKTIVLVGHLFWIKSVLGKILNVPYSEIQKKSVKNASITTLKANQNNETTTFEVKVIGGKKHLNFLV